MKSDFKRVINLISTENLCKTMRLYGINRKYTKQKDRESQSNDKLSRSNALCVWCSGYNLNYLNCLRTNELPVKELKGQIPDLV